MASIFNTLKKLFYKNHNRFTPMWRRTNDIMGHEPLFDLVCYHCGSPMFLRHSTTSVLDEDDEDEKRLEMNCMCYKCPTCAWFVRFDVRDKTKYINEILDKRQGQVKLIPLDDWMEDTEIKRQLESLGYVCGR